MLNQTDRFSLAIDVIDRGPGLLARGAHAHGVDRADVEGWTWRTGGGQDACGATR